MPIEVKKLIALKLSNNTTENIKYDGFGRTKEVKNDKLSKDIYYQQIGDKANNFVSSVRYGVNGIVKDGLKYKYDIAGNISHIYENGKLTARYGYDKINRLVREDSLNFGTFTYEYDSNGNIIGKTKYPYTLKEELQDNGTRTEYLYSDNNDKDRLVLYNNQAIQYDNCGRPVNYLGNTLSWERRNLKSFGSDITYTYNASGIRTSKTVNGTTTKYYLDGSKILAEKTNSNTIYYHYSVDGIAGFCYNGIEYIYRKNIQGDVTHIYDLDGNLCARYTYDAWGRWLILRL